MNTSKEVGLTRLGSTFYLSTPVAGGIYLILSVYISKVLCAVLIQTVCSLKNFNYMNIILYIYI